MCIDNKDSVLHCSSQNILQLIILIKCEEELNPVYPERSVASLLVTKLYPPSWKCFCKWYMINSNITLIKVIFRFYHPNISDNPGNSAKLNIALNVALENNSMVVKDYFFFTLILISRNLVTVFTIYC